MSKESEGTPKTYVIIGGGAAGVFAAKAIRDCDATGNICLYTDEPQCLLSRPRLPEYLSGVCTSEELVVFPAEWYKKNRVDCFTDVRIVHINSQDREIITESGDHIHYDKLLVAVGSKPARLRIEGCMGEHVYTVRSVADIDALKDRAKTAQCCVMIGGGLLGLEIAYALSLTGLRVTVVEYFDRLMPRQLDAEGSAMLQHILEEKGLSFILGAETVGIDEKSGEKVLTLKNKEPVCADFVVISAGIKPEIALANDAGITTGVGVVVNDRMETSKKDIYAAGDCAEHGGRLYGLWSAAMEQGQCAGKNMAGTETEYHGSTISTVLKVAGVEVASLGDITCGDVCDYEIVTHADKDTQVYKKFFMKNRRLCGAILIGNNKAVMPLKKYIAQETEVDDPQKLLAL